MSDLDAADGGAFVVIIGPDGTGKTTLARRLVAGRTATRYFHFRPSLRGPMLERPPDDERLPEMKIPSRRPGDLPKGWLRLVRSVLICTVAYWLRIRPAVQRGELVIGDRWIYGYMTQPTPLRYYGPRWLARTLIRMTPEPTVTVNLAAPVDVLLARKEELSADLLSAELAAARRLPLRRMVTVSSEQAQDLLAHEVAALISGRTAPGESDGAGGAPHGHDEQ